MIIDVRVSGAARSQFATQLAVVSLGTLEQFTQAFAGDETPDFYEGLFAGLAAAYQMVASWPVDEAKGNIGAMLAYLAGKGHLEPRNA